MPELALFLLVLNLDVRERSQHLRIPVDDSRAAIQFAVLEQVDEGLAHRVARSRVEREGGAVPVAGRAHPTRLRGDSRSRDADPVPDTLLERLAPEVVPSHAFAGELLLDHALRRDPGVVQTGQPERRLAQHPVPADQRVLDRQRDCMTQVQHPGHVWRRHDHGERLSVVLGGIGRTEPAVVLPEGVDRIFDQGGVVGAGQAAEDREIEFSSGHGRTPLDAGMVLWLSC